MNYRLRAVSAVLLLSSAFAFAQDEAKAEPAKEVDIVWGVKIPARDGVKLNATVYKPHGQTEKLPVVFTFTPYISDSYHPRAWHFAQNGYVFALIDVRGRGNSGGAFEPFANEGRDGHDVVEWLAQPPRAEGRGSKWGGAFPGVDPRATPKK